MKKDYLKWHKEKSDIHELKNRPFFHERDIWFASTGANIGFEIDGKGEKFLRPLLIVKKFNNESFLSLPVTKKEKTGKYYFSFNLDGRGINTIILSQVKLMDAKRLQYKIGNINDEIFKNIKQKLKDLIS